MKLKDYIWIAIGVVVLVLLVQTCNDTKEIKKLYAQDLSRTDSLLRTQRDSFYVFREFMGKVVTEDQLKNSLDENMVAIRSTLNGLGYKIKDIESIMRLNLITTGQLEGALSPILTALDSLNGDTLNFTNVINWDDLFGNLTKNYAIAFDDERLKFDGKFNIAQGTTDAKYTYRNQLTLVSTWNKRLFKPDYATVGVLSDDPNSEITLSSYKVQQPKNLFDISVQVGYGLTMDGLKIKNSPFMGLGISKKIFSVNRKN